MSQKNEKALRRQGSLPPGNGSAHFLGSQLSITQITSSILPPASELQKIEELSPGATTELIKLVKDQSAHRMDLEKYVIARDCEKSSRGQFLAFILGLVALIGGFVLVAIGKDAGGIASMIAGVGTLLTAFGVGAALRKREREKKMIPENARKNKR